MCGRYAAAKDPAALVEEFEVVSGPEELLEPDFNVAPTKHVYIVVDRPREDVLERALVVARWGLVPSWAKDPSIGARMINARSETLAEKPAFRSAFAKRRCLVPADGYYEWYTPDAAAGGRPVKQPFFIHPADGSSLAMAGLYEWWRDPTREADDPQAWRLTCTIITTNATDDIGQIHDRMPMIVDRADWPAWLDPQAGADVGALVRPASQLALAAYPVSTAVNRVANNGPGLIAPLEPEEPDSLF